MMRRLGTTALALVVLAAGCSDDGDAPENGAAAATTAPAGEVEVAAAAEPEGSPQRYLHLDVAEPGEPLEPPFRLLLVDRAAGTEQVIADDVTWAWSYDRAADRVWWVGTDDNTHWVAADGETGSIDGIWHVGDDGTRVRDAKGKQGCTWVGEVVEPDGTSRTVTAEIDGDTDTCGGGEVTVAVVAPDGGHVALAWCEGSCDATLYTVVDLGDGSVLTTTGVGYLDSHGVWRTPEQLVLSGGYDDGLAFDSGKIVDLGTRGAVVTDTEQSPGRYVVRGGAAPGGWTQQVEHAHKGPDECDEPDFEGPASGPCHFSHYDEDTSCQVVLIDPEGRRHEVSGACGPWVFPDDEFTAARRAPGPRGR